MDSSTTLTRAKLANPSASPSPKTIGRWFKYLAPLASYGLLENRRVDSLAMENLQILRFTLPPSLLHAQPYLHQLLLQLHHQLPKLQLLRLPQKLQLLLRLPEPQRPLLRRDLRRLLPMIPLRMNPLTPDPLDHWLLYAFWLHLWHSSFFEAVKVRYLAF